MIVLGWDLESTGLDTQNDVIIEVGAIIYDTEARVPLEILSNLVRPQAPLPEGYVSPTGIRVEWLVKYGKTLPEVFGEVQRLIAASSPVCVISHNGENFDRPLTMSELKRHSIQDHSLETMHWLDPRTDIPFKKEPASRSLTNLAAEHGFLNPFPHRAIFDVTTMLKLLDQYNFDEVYQASLIPWITIRALATYDTRQKAKDLRFAWDGAKQIWTKKIKEHAMDREAAAAEAIGLKIVRL